MRRRVTILMLILVCFAFGVATGHYRTFPFNQLKNTKAYFSTKVFEVKYNSLADCSVPEIKNLPNNFSIIVGHAYGAHRNATLESFISSNLDIFLRDYGDKINAAIFTGDVFSIPSTTKWNQLFDRLDGIEVHIAPGNHDVLRPDSREAFVRSNAFYSELPYTINIGNYRIVIDDSIVSKWNVGKKTIWEVNNEVGEVIVARHNVPIAELSRLSNGQPGPSNLKNVNDFKILFNEDKMITWIIGDGGAFPNLPRISCKKYLNHRFIINGLGDLEDDKILILKSENIYQYRLKK